MKSQRLDKMGADRWSVVEDAMGPRYTALVMAVVIVAYCVVGALE